MLLFDNLVKPWDLALIDLALYRPRAGAPESYLVVPNVRNIVKGEARPVVRVIVEGERPSARVEVERVDVDDLAPGRRRWDEQRFFDNLVAEGAPAPVRELATKLRDLASRFPASMALAWGTGIRVGSMVLKRNGASLIEVFGTGEIRFRINKFAKALGELKGVEYGAALDRSDPAPLKCAIRE